MISKNKALRDILAILVKADPDYQGMIDAINYVGKLEGVRDGMFTSELEAGLEEFLNVSGFLVAQKALESLTDEQYEHLQAYGMTKVDAAVEKLHTIGVPMIAAGLVASSLTHDLIQGSGERIWNAVMAVIDSQLPAATDAEC